MLSKQLGDKLETVYTTDISVLCATEHFYMQCMQITEYKYWHRHWLDVVVIGVDVGRTVLAALHAGLHAYTSWQYWMNKRDSRNVGN